MLKNRIFRGSFASISLIVRHGQSSQPSHFICKMKTFFHSISRADCRPLPFSHDYFRFQILFSPLKPIYSFERKLLFDVMSKVENAFFSSSIVRLNGKVQRFDSASSILHYATHTRNRRQFILYILFNLSLSHLQATNG